jgi:hypothetical protein
MKLPYYKRIIYITAYTYGWEDALVRITREPSKDNSSRRRKGEVINDRMEIYDLPKPRSIGFVRLFFWTECLDDRSAALVARSLCKIIRVGIQAAAKHLKK